MNLGGGRSRTLIRLPRRGARCKASGPAGATRRVSQGSAVSNVCGTQKTAHAPQGATFSAQVCTSDAVDKVNLRFHYSDDSAGGWSGTASVIP